jgi:hypothetical protein
MDANCISLAHTSVLSARVQYKQYSETNHRYYRRDLLNVYSYSQATKQNNLALNMRFMYTETRSVFMWKVRISELNSVSFSASKMRG